MRNKFFIVLSFVFIGLLMGVTCLADYPIFYQRYTADPSGLEANGRIYLYCSHDVYDSSRPGYIMNDITCISTDDLKNWTDHGEVFQASGWASLAWAPSMVAKNNKYYMYFGNGGGGIGVAVSDSPTGPFKDPLGKALVTNSTPGVNPPSNFWCFDPCAFVDDNGQAYLYFGGNGEGNIRVVRLNSDMISINGSASQMVAPRFFEASWMHKYNGKYYFSYSTDFSRGAATINYMTSNSPTSGFVDKGTVLANPPYNEGNNNHHAIFSYKGNWYIAYHNRSLAITNGAPAGDARTYQRNVCIDRLYYNADGTMKQVEITTNGLSQLKYVNPYTTNEAETMARGFGIQTESCSEGGRNVSYIENGDWILVKGVDFGSGATSFEARVASATNGGNIELRLGSPTGKLVGTCAVSGTGGWQSWVTKSCNVSGATGVQDLYFKFTGGSDYLFNFNSWKFSSNIISPTPTPTVTVNPTPTPSATVIPSPTPTPTATQGATGCTVSYNQSDWGSGASVSITIKNNGATAINGWSLTWDFTGNQKITNMWNATYTQNGTTVTAKNVSYNGTIPAKGSVTFGFNISYSGSNAKPTRFSLNGTACQVD